MSQDKEGCVSSAAGPLVDSAVEDEPIAASPTKKEPVMTARVGHPAPDFEATALHNGAFKNIRLSEYLGQWVVLCFYPGDFTFV